MFAVCSLMPSGKNLTVLVLVTVASLIPMVASLIHFSKTGTINFNDSLAALPKCAANNKYLGFFSSNMYFIVFIVVLILKSSKIMPSLVGTLKSTRNTTLNPFISIFLKYLLSTELLSVILSLSFLLFNKFSSFVLISFSFLLICLDKLNVFICSTTRIN